MHIIVLVKQVPDPKKQAGLRSDGTIEREKAKNIINPYDKNALEAALRIKDKTGAKVTVVSMGPLQAKDAIIESYAMGADDGILVSDAKLAGSDTLATSYALAKTIQKIGSYDLVLCGMETVDGNTGQMGPEVAEMLSIPQMTYVEEMKVEGNVVEARRLIEGGYERLQAKLPALLTITSSANEPRFPSVMNVMRASRKPFATWTAADIGMDETRIGLVASPTKIKKMDRPQAKAASCAMFEEDKLDEFLSRLKADGINLVSKK